MRRLSSAMTLYWKVIMPSMWLAAFIPASVILAIARPHNFPWFVFPVATVLGALMFSRLAWPLKRVDLDGNTLIISNFLREIRVPLSEVSNVVEWRGINPTPIVLTLRSETPFGTKITFTPKREWALFSEHSVTQELRALTGLPSGRSRARHPDAAPVSSSNGTLLKVLLPILFAILANLPNLFPSRFGSLQLLAIPLGLASLGALRLKRVVALGGRLVVSTFGREIDVRPDDIVGVRAWRILGVPVVRVKLRAPTEFGQSFVFMPRVEFAAGQSLRELAGDSAVESLSAGSTDCRGNESAREQQ